MADGKNLFADADIIHSYTRADALADGTLVDVTEWASAEKGMMGGFTCPVALTATVWQAIQMIPPSLEGLADVRGRAHDVLFMARLSVSAASKNGGRASYRVILPRLGTRSRYLDLVLDLGPGDNGEIVATIGEPTDF